MCLFYVVLGGCVEGMCASGSLAARKGCLPGDIDLALLEDRDPVWDACAFQLAQLCLTIVLIASPEQITLGGGVMNRASLYPKIRVIFLTV